VAWYFSVLANLKTQLESGPGTADLTTTVVYSYTSMINESVIEEYKLLAIHLHTIKIVFCLGPESNFFVTF